MRDLMGQKQTYIKIFGRTTDESSSITAGQELVLNLMLWLEFDASFLVTDGNCNKFQLLRKSGFNCINFCQRF